MSLPISVLVPTRNERRNIEACLDSIIWSNDVVVVDSGSTDGTTEIAARQGARVVDFRWNGQLPKKKNWALENVDWRNEWVFILDADERVPPEMQPELARAVEGRPELAGYFVDRRFMFMGRWIRHSGYSPSWNLRLFKHRLGRYELLVDGDVGAGDVEIHEHVVLGGRAGRLKTALLHYAYPDIATWVEKHNRYSSWEAAVEVRGPQWATPSIGTGLARRRRLRHLARRLPFRPGLRFLYSYFLKAGFLDGYPGYVLCRLLAAYELLSVFKAQELLRRQEPEAATPPERAPSSS